MMAQWCIFSMSLKPLTAAFHESCALSSNKTTTSNHFYQKIKREKIKQASNVNSQKLQGSCLAPSKDKKSNSCILEQRVQMHAHHKKDHLSTFIFLTKIVDLLWSLSHTQDMLNWMHLPHSDSFFAQLKKSLLPVPQIA